MAELIVFVSTDFVLLQYPFTGILISPIFADFAMSALSLSVALRALRLLREDI